MIQRTYHTVPLSIYNTRLNPEGARNSTLKQFLAKEENDLSKIVTEVIRQDREMEGPDMTVFGGGAIKPENGIIMYFAEEIGIKRIGLDRVLREEFSTDYNPQEMINSHIDRFGGEQVNTRYGSLVMHQSPHTEQELRDISEFYNSLR